MSNGINFSGLASGLDTQAIINQLIDIERRPITLIQQRQVRLEQQKSIIQEINTGLLSLKEEAAGLADESLFSIVNVSSTDSSKVAVSGTNEAAAGTFSVEVLGLAQARSLSSRSFSTTGEALNLEGEFVVNGTSIEVSADDSLVDIRDTINGAGAGINGQILTVAPGDNRLIVTAETVGASGFDLRDASSADILQGLGFTSSVEQVKNTFADGARSDRFLSDTDAIGGLLNLGSPPAGSITIDGEQIAVNLATDSLNDIRDAINAAGLTGVTADVVSADEGGITRYHLEVAGTTAIADNTGVLETLGMLDSGGAIVDEIVAGAESDAFTSTTTSVGSLLGLGQAPSGSVTIAGQVVAIDLAQDSLTDVQTKINDAAIAGVTATVTTTSDEDGNSQFRLRIDGTTDLVDAGNVFEALGVLEGSNSAFESVARVLTGNAANQERGALLHATGGGFKTDEVNSDTDPLGPIVGSTAAGTVRIGGTDVAIDLNVDSINDVRDAINAAGIAGVSAAVNITGPTSFELEISGTQDVVDDNGVLEALGVMAAPTTLTANTRFADILGGDVAAGDTISITGLNHDGDQVAGTFTITSTNLKVDNLLTQVEQLFGGEVTASIDASGRVVLTDDVSGSSSLALTLTANNEGGGNLSFGTLSATTQGTNARSSELQAGQDAEVRINGITLRRSSNTITDAVEGVTLTLREKTDAGEPIEVSVSKDDTTQLRSRLEGFVAEFNSAMSLINDQFVFDDTTETSGPLAGDSTLLGLQSRLRNVIITQIDTDSELNALSRIGITFDRNGRLTIDDETLTGALENNLTDVQALFVAKGSATSGKAEFVRSSSRTEAGSYALQVTQAAERAVLLGTIDASAGIAEDQTLTITETNNDKVAIVELAAGDDTDAIAAKINAALSSEVAEVRTASLANTTDGTTPVTEATAFSDIFGAGVVDGDTIRIQGTTHQGGTVTREFVIADAATTTIGDLLAETRAAFGNKVSAIVDDEGRIVVTGNQVGPSQLTVAFVEKNEGLGSLDLGSIEKTEAGRFAMEMTAVNVDGQLQLQHDTFGARAGFAVTQSVDQLGLAGDTVSGRDVAGTINGETADGFGRILTGARDNETTDGLAIRVSATAAEVAASNDLGSVNLVYGIGRILDDTLGFITDTFDGTLKSREEAIDDTIDNLQDQIASMERRVEQTRSNLIGKFSTLEATMSTLQSQGNFLSSQLAGLSR